MDAAAYIRRETIVNVAINVALSLAFFLAMFGTEGPVPVWGAGAYVFDFAPQGFMIGLMSIVVPGLLARRALTGGKVVRLHGAAVLPSGIVVRAILCGAIGAAAGLGGSALVFRAIGALQIDWLPALVAKLVFGGVLALAVTPPGLRAELIKR